METAIVISLLALVASLISILWNVGQYFLLNKVRLELDVRMGELCFSVEDIKKTKPTFMPVDPPLIGERDSPVIFFSMVNVGSRPLVVGVIGGKYKRSYKKNSELYFRIFTRELPKKLQPYEMHVEYVDSTKMELVKHLENNDIAYFFAEDTKGKLWRISKERMQRLLKDVQIEQGTKSLKQS